MKRIATFAVLAGFVFITGQMPGHAQDKPVKEKTKKSAKPSATSAAVFVDEKGRFKVMADGQLVATEEFQISGNGGEWHARGNSEVPASAAGSTSKVSGKLDLTGDGRPVRYEWSASAPKKASAVIEFSGGTAKMELRMDNAAPFNQDFTFDSARVVILDNNLYHHYAILARLYDWKAKGPQSFTVFIPQDTTPGIVLVEYGGAKVVEGVQLEMLRVRSADNEIELYCDSSAKLLRISVPSSKVEIIRE